MTIAQALQKKRPSGSCRNSAPETALRTAASPEITAAEFNFGYRLR
jgi:hypothetical protein